MEKDLPTDPHGQSGRRGLLSPRLRRAGPRRRGRGCHRADHKM